MRQEYLDAVVSLNKRNNERGNTGAIVIGHPSPGIGENLHDVPERHPRSNSDVQDIF